MDLGLQGKTALVSGGSKGIGRAIADGLAREGVRVAITARTASDLDAAAAAIRAKTGNEVVSIAADLSRLDEVTRTVATARERLGRIDILVNNAGAIRGGDFLTIPDEQWADDLRELRRFAGEATAADPWKRLILDTGVLVAIDRGRQIEASIAARRSSVVIHPPCFGLGAD